MRFFNKIRKTIKTVRSFFYLNEKISRLQEDLDVLTIGKSHISHPRDSDMSKIVFILFNYKTAVSETMERNLGDDIQTIATQSAINFAIPMKNNYIFFDRDSLFFFKSKKSTDGLYIAIMQGWFSYTNYFIPTQDIHPLFIGTHIIRKKREFIEKLVRYNPKFFANTDIGCRDISTHLFFQSLGVSSYFSRCLTLTLPLRKSSNDYQQVFFVNLNKKIKKYIPKKIKKNAIDINQRWLREDFEDSPKQLQKASLLLEQYKTQASLIITTALHCAAPCLAMGIPVVLIKECSEQDDRFSALSGILKYYDMNDLKKGLVNFSPNAPNIENLKSAMIENLSLSIKQAIGMEVDTTKLSNIRDYIANFNILDSRQ